MRQNMCSGVWGCRVFDSGVIGVGGVDRLLFRALRDVGDVKVVLGCVNMSFGWSEEYISICVSVSVWLLGGMQYKIW